VTEGYRQAFARHSRPGSLQAIAVTVHQCLNGRTPPYLLEHCIPVSSADTRRHLRSANRHLLAVPRFRRNTYGRRAFSVACLAHQSHTSTVLTYLSADIQLVSERGRRHLRSSSYRTLAVPRTRTILGDRSLAVAGPRAWNSLPATL